MLTARYGSERLSLSHCRCPGGGRLANFTETEWERYSEWAHARVKRAEPEGPAAAGQTVHFTGMGLGFTFKVEAFGPSSHQLDVHEAGPRKVLESRAEGYVLGRARRSTRRVLLRPIKAI